MDFFEITSNDLTTLVGYIGDLIGNFMPIILLFLGVKIVSMIIDITRR